MEKIIINGKEYGLKTIDFMALRKLEKLGFTIKTLENLEENYWNALSSLVAFIIDSDVNNADKEIEAHIDNGGTIEDFIPLFNMISKSDFFQKLSKHTKK